MEKNITRQSGFWSSVYIAVLGVIYLLLLIINFSTQGFVFPPSRFVQLSGGIITFLTIPGLIVLYTAIHYLYDGENKILGSLGITFITLFAATVGINRFVQRLLFRSGTLCQRIVLANHHAPIQNQINVLGKPLDQMEHLG